MNSLTDSLQHTNAQHAQLSHFSANKDMKRFFLMHPHSKTYILPPATCCQGSTGSTRAQCKWHVAAYSKATYTEGKPTRCVFHTCKQDSPPTTRQGGHKEFRDPEVWFAVPTTAPEKCQQGCRAMLDPQPPVGAPCVAMRVEDPS